jgi:hypothetical protein
MLPIKVMFLLAFGSKALAAETTIVWASIIFTNPGNGGSSCNQFWAARKGSYDNADGQHSAKIGMGSTSIDDTDPDGNRVTIDFKGCDCAGDCSSVDIVWYDPSGVTYSVDGKQCQEQETTDLESGVIRSCDFPF